MGGVEAGVGGGVKIIVKMDAVQRIVLHQLGYALHDVVGGFRDGGVQVQPLAHGADPLRVGVGEVGIRQAGRAGGGTAEPVGVDPRFQRQAPPVCLGEQDVQRVEARVLPLHAGAEVAPRVEGTGVKCIPERPHLHEHGVQPEGSAVVQQGGGVGPERLGGGKIHPRKFQIAHPDGAPLSRRQGRVGCGEYFAGRGCFHPGRQAEPVP